MGEVAVEEGFNQPKECERTFDILSIGGAGFDLGEEVLGDLGGILRNNW